MCLIGVENRVMKYNCPLLILTANLAGELHLVVRKTDRFKSRRLDLITYPGNALHRT